MVRSYGAHAIADRERGALDVDYVALGYPYIGGGSILATEVNPD
jgi:hypothetical protein